ncbi:MAG: carbohydrate ABC transporter permease [Deltaproteobacteria bacterium]|nr:MAG: carbohydrate ABC transporter permease [Deltaproteobacteria bacterium]
MTMRIKKRYVVLAMALLLSIGYLFPLIWMLNTSLRTVQDIYRFPPSLFPQKITLENYIYVTLKIKMFGRFFLNSVVVTLATMVLVVLFSAMGGYAFGFKKFKGQNVLFLGIIFVLMVPYIVYLIPIYMMEDRLRLTNTWGGLILPYVALNLPWGLLIMRGAFSTIPKDVADAAIIDGCNELQLWSRVLLPLTKPSLAATAVVTFVFAWQEYMFASTLMTENKWQTLPVGIVWIKDELQTLVYGRVGATIILAILPVFVLFVVFRNFFIKGLSEGMLKG